MTDHLPIFQITEYKHNNNITIIQSSRRLTNERNINTLINDLVNADWKEIYDSDDINCMYNTFTEKITELYQSNCPVIYEKVKRKRPDKPWMTNGLKHACRKKNLLYKEFLKTRTNVSEEKYKKYKNKLTAILRRCEKQYLTELLEINKGNMKETWKILNGLINKKSKGKQISTEFNGDESKITGDKTIANGFNNVFVNIGPSLAKRIPKCKDSLFTQFLPDKIEDTMFLQPVTEEEIMQQVKNAKNKKSKDHDQFDMCLVKKIIPYIVKPLAHICNTSLMNGIFPDRMKIARVIPLFKNGDVKEFSNYRPVSILPQFSKILEKVFHNRLMSFINDKQILNNSQFGFRKNMSTALAIIELVEEITTAIDEGKTTVGVFIDLKKAFDTVDHNILVKTLEHYGIRGLAKDWVCSYLESRRQYVCINDSNSDCLDVKCGVPQGSILGPALFILYVNDMCNVSKYLKSILFADDTNLFYAGKDLDEVCKIVSRELNILHIWFQVNKLSLNVAKTNFMIFGNNRFEENYMISINGMNINRVYVTKFLGVHIDSKLNWNEHISVIKTKVAKNVSIMNRVKHCLINSALYSLYCTLILPYLSYCCEIWGNTYKSRIHPLYIMQKRAIRICGNSDYRAHTRQIFYQLKTLCLPDMVNFNSMVFMYKVFNNSLPNNLLVYFKKVYDCHQHNTRKKNVNFKIRFSRTTMKATSLCMKAPKMWNELCNSVKLCSSVQEFKHKYKIFLLKNNNY